ncbi:DUF1772 domain-containing protein [Sciscionella marina]|uniref:DUF1772 domain-containing protein n=1 Tax=Sciscionella marina TaxID=508770 RepID=UPI0004756EC9|nr:DUF1772 domain-containing protein [Sciscionella marina]
MLLTATAATASSAAFATGCLLTQLVTVPTWRAMEPTTFLKRFVTSGPATGAILFPVEAAAVALLGATTYTVTRQRLPGRLAWGAATASMTATVILLPVYFGRANTALLDPAFPPSNVADELSRWSKWNWVRTTLGVAATVAGGAATTAMLRRGRGRDA